MRVQDTTGSSYSYDDGARLGLLVVELVFYNKSFVMSWSRYSQLEGFPVKQKMCGCQWATVLYLLPYIKNSQNHKNPIVLLPGFVPAFRTFGDNFFGMGFFLVWKLGKYLDEIVYSPWLRDGVLSHRHFVRTFYAREWWVYILTGKDFWSTNLRCISPSCSFPTTW